MEKIFVKNYNNRLQCDVFGVIHKQPHKGIASDRILSGEFTYEISSDEGVKFEAQLMTLLRFDGQYIPEVVSYMSHGVGPDELLKQLRKDIKLKSADQLALYIFKKKTVNGDRGNHPDKVPPEKVPGQTG